MLVITGNPGVGKKTVARIVGHKLSLDFVDITEVALKGNAVKTLSGSECIVDLRKLSSLMRGHVEKQNLIIGHLAPYVLRKNDPSMVAVIRRSPYELKTVYNKRRYDDEKAAENLSSEIIGICLYDAIKKFGSNKVAEFDNTSTSASVTANKIISTFKGKMKKNKGKIDWLSLIAKNGDMRMFFQYGKS